MPDGYLVSEADYTILQALLTEFRNRPKGTTGRTGPDWDIHQAPEVYICLTPAGGIPALVEGPDTGTASLGAGDIVSSAECEVYQLIESATATTASLSKVYGLTKRVYNLLDVAIGPWRWITPMRDKFGRWVIPATGLEYGECP